MDRRLRDGLAASRRRAFVGRTAERELFESGLLPDGESALTVLYVQGPGGVGKSALLRMFAEQAAMAGYRVLNVDGHDVRPNAVSFLDVAGPGSGGDPKVVLVDTYELLEPLDDWLREEFVAGLPAGSKVVIAGRRAVPAGWRSDPGWRDLLRVIRLGNLGVDDASRYLVAAGVPPELCDRTATAVRGHPLALALVVDLLAQRGPDAVAGGLLNDPDVVAVLVSRLLDGVPGEQRRSALAVCALARFTTEPLLRAVLEIDDAHDLFEWLRGLSCTEAGPLGLYPHDLARDALVADLRWRDETRCRVLEQRILGHARERIGAERGRAQKNAIFDVFFSMRTDPVTSRFYTWETFGSVVPEPVATADRAAVLELVATREGPESAALAAQWFEQQPEAFSVYRARGEIAGMVAWLTLEHAGAADAIVDPVAVGMWRHIARRGPLQPGEYVILNRFTIDREVYQGPSPATELAGLIQAELAVRRPGLAWAVIVATDPDFWAPFFVAIGHEPTPGPDCRVGGRRYSLFARDARAPGRINDHLPAPAEAPGAVLTRPVFAESVRAALRDLGRVDLLARNPLMALPVVAEAGGGPAALRAVLVETADVLRGHPRDEKLFRAVDRTYLRPAPTQERAAELLGLPFSTYRRHRREGVARIVDRLWEHQAGSVGN